MTKRVTRLGTDPTWSVLVRLSLPAMTGLFINATYNVVDSLFVGRHVGTAGLAAVGVIFPFFILIIGMGILIGAGGSVLISRHLGEGEEEKARTAFGSAFFLLLLFGLLFVLVGAPFPTFWVRLLGGTSAYATDYFSIIAFGAPLIICNLALNSMVYAEGNGIVGFIALTMSSVLNIILDWLFIVIFGMEVQGAALATLIAQASGTLILIVYFMLPASHIRLNLSVRLPQVRSILKIGLSSGVRTFSIVFVGLAVNRQALLMGGELTVAVASVIFRVISLIVLPALGINQAFMPIASYNYGAQKHDRVIRTSWQAFLMTLTVCYVLVVLIMVFADGLAGVFNSDPQFMTMASSGFRVAFLMSPFIVCNLLCAGLHQAMGRPYRSLLVAISRTLFFILPLLIVLPHFFGTQGLWLAFPIGEVLSAIFAILMGIPALKQLRKPTMQAT